MAKLSAQERDALLRLVKVEVQAKENQKREELKSTIGLTEEEELLIKLYEDSKNLLEQYNNIINKFNALKNKLESKAWQNNFQYTIEEYREKVFNEKINNIIGMHASNIIISKISDDLIVQGISKDFNVEQWLSEMKTKYSI